MKLVVQSLKLGLASVGEKLFGGDGDGERGELVAVVQKAYFGHDVVLEGEGCVGNVSARVDGVSPERVSGEEKIEEGKRGGRGEDSLETPTDFAEAVLVPSRIQRDMSVLFAAQNAVPNNHLVRRLSQVLKLISNSSSSRLLPSLQLTCFFES